jgi:glutamate-ammonia-ligase adenylyltransferase
MTNHQFFKRLAENLIAEVTRAAPEGMLFRIDLRLRPEGDAGPLVRSLASYENYYAQWGQTWERMMLIKARGVAGSAALAAEFLEMVQPFRYPRSLNEGVLHEIAAMKARLETEVVKAGEIDRNVKLGRGGIREIEFVVQTLQLLYAGRSPFLQGAQTLTTLQQLVQYRLLSSEQAQTLTAAYCFLRDVEHRLQMEHNLQTHTIPADRKARELLAALMGFRKLSAFEAALEQHTHQVRQVYDQLLKAEAPESHPALPRAFSGTEAEWKQILAAHAFKDLDKSFRLLHQFASGPGYVHVSPRTVELAWQLIPKLLALCPKAIEPAVVGKSRGDVPAREVTGGGVPSLERGADGVARRPYPSPKARAEHKEALISQSQIANRKSQINESVLSDPDRVLARLDSFITVYGARATLLETWTHNPQLFELLLLLFDRSEFLAETAIRTPDLVDELVLSGRLRRRKSAEEILQELRHGRSDKDQHLWLRRYHQAELMRIGLRDILGLADFEQNLDELSALADACLRYALEVVLGQHKLKTSPLVIIGLGKLGGQELNYGSDLDIMFVAHTATKNLPKLQRLAVAVMDLLSTRTEMGTVFVTDARLRPDGEKGLLVNTLEAYGDYYRHRAMLWEIQALTRTRAVAGDAELGQRFQQLAAALTDFRPDSVAAGFVLKKLAPPKASSARRKSSHAPPRPKTGLSAYTPDWKKKIAHMRQRIEKERTPAGRDALAIKTGAGGLMDAEFIAQTLCLAHGWHEANTLRALERARDNRVLPRPEADRLIENYRQLRRIEGILRRWSFEGETTLPSDPAPFYRVSVRCGFATPEAFREAIAGYRRNIREIYANVFADG